MVFSSGYVCNRERGDCVILRQYRVGRREEEFLLAITSTSEHRRVVQQVDTMLFEAGRRMLKTGSLKEFDKVVRQLTVAVNGGIEGGGGFAMLLCLGDRACVCNTGNFSIWVETDRLGHRVRRRIGEMGTESEGKNGRGNVMLLDVVTIPNNIRLELGAGDKETAIWIDAQ